MTICAERPGLVHTDLDLPVRVGSGLEAMAGADVVILLPPDKVPLSITPALREALTAAHGRGAIILAACTSTYLLAAAGLLDGLRATTHRSLLDDFAARYPAVTVDREALYVDQGDIITGVGEPAAVDMGLHLVRREHGAAVADIIARELTASPHRHGDQARHLGGPVPPTTTERQLDEAMAWARANLDRRTSVDDLAARVHMSPRTFARHFKAVTGTTPHAWLLSQRLSHAEELLETTDLKLEEISRLVGYGSVAVLREHFVKHRGVSPRAYRQAFKLASGR
ncbi:GlxA family transcriptional regulator [Nonomuraea longicatena]|uniref:GlxA family transcriptional regulator n=1 Tax=Nonomuraea longicatena TaxID=83682 RepID=UPI0031D89AE1